MAIFDDSGIRFEYTLTSRVDRPQPQPTIENRTVRINTPVSVFSATVRATAPNGSAELVDGKWRADTASAKGAQQLVDLTLYLVNRELAAKKAQ